MKFHLKKLNQRGFDHVVAIVVFVVIFAGIGTYLLVASHAATPPPELIYGISSGTTCLNEEAGGVVNVATCNGNVGQKYGFNSSNGEIDLNAGCVAVSGTSSTSLLGQNRLYVSTSCKSTPYGGAWTQSGHMFENRHADSKRGSYCLGLSGTTVELTSCNQNWYPAAYNSTRTSGNSPWALTGTTTETDASGPSLTFTSTIKNVGPNASGSFQYGPRYFYSSTSSPLDGSNGVYPGEAETVANKTDSSLKSGATITGISQTITIPQKEKSAYVCSTVAFSPYNYLGSANGRSAPVCISVAQQLQYSPSGK